jgi:hypothetical protein
MTDPRSGGSTEELHASPRFAGLVAGVSGPTPTGTNNNAHDSPAGANVRKKFKKVRWPNGHAKGRLLTTFEH